MKRGGPLKRYTPLQSYGNAKIISETPLKRKGKSESATLAEKLWQLCRQIIFKRYGNECYTCGATNLVGRNLQLGHFITDATCSTELSYHLDNLRPQCFRCNIHLSGNWSAFEARLRRDGIDTEALKRLNEATKGGKYGTLWYLVKLQEYGKIYEALTL